MIFVSKNDGESSERLIQRFTKRVQQSRLVQSTRSKRYYKKKDTKRKVRKAAIMRDHYRSLREKMKYYG